MYQKRFQQASDGSHEINVTPLIDVSLVLVVILLLAAPLAFESSIGVRSGAAQGREAQSTTELSTIEITVLSDGQIRVNRETLARDDLASTLVPLIAESRGHRVLVSTEPGVTHGDFVHVLDQAKRCGATDIAVAGG